jgi:nucleotide-binding universal stress UspA family protein
MILPMPNRIRKFLVVADDSPECRKALYFAARRAMATGASVSVLAVLEPNGFNHWIGVAEVVKRDAQEAAYELLESMAADAKRITNVRPELLLREGERLDVLAHLLEEDPLISLLILASSPSMEGPGPLVSALAKGKGLFADRTVPVTVVPGNMEITEIDALT